MSSYVIINGKKFVSTSANEVFEKNHSEEQYIYFNDTKNSIDAMWTEHIKIINKELENTQYKAGRPAKTATPKEMGE